VLYLDESAEFRREALEALEGPLRSGQATRARGDSLRSFPARFLLVAAADPCPCGRGPADPDCPCHPHEVERYRAKIAAALGEVEISLAVAQPTIADIGGPPGESSAVVGDRVYRARELQERRLGPGRCNAEMTSEETRSCPLHSEAAVLIAELDARHRLSARARDRVLRIAQTLADLEEVPVIEERHLTQSCRLLPSVLGSIAR
jgi:magnesium chelatase family protein